EIHEMKCLYCQHVQPVQQQCVQCQKSMARYYCAMCKLFEDDPEKQTYHCDDCKLCRRGKKETMRHCAKCNCDYFVDYFKDHACRENILSRCPICCEELFSSVKPFMDLKCGHYLHVHCLEDMLKCRVDLDPSGSACPTCKKSIYRCPDEDKQIESFLE